MDVSTSQDHVKDVARQQEPERETTKSPQKMYKPKPFTEIVRMQRPEVTRKKANKFAGQYDGELDSYPQQDTTRSSVTSARTELTERERQMIYG